MTWATLFGLGAFHGINPGMGWLFAVALGMQERRRAAVWRTLLPLAAGHALAVGAAVAVALAVGSLLRDDVVRWSVAAVLVALGLYRLVRSRHPRFGGMRVSLRDLVVWSFLMASAHGAGLMVLPMVVPGPTGLEHGGLSAGVAVPAGHDAMTGHGISATAGVTGGLAATAVHTLGYLLVTGLLAWLVYEKLGVLFLRRAWLNVDLLWAVALVATGLLTAAL